MRNLALSVAIIFILSPIVSQTVEPYDIMITELMIDPNPVVGLPNFEWIELYNRSAENINLADFRYSSGATKYKLPSYDLASGAYVMLCDDSDIVELRTFGEAIDIKTFPSLTNGGDAATLEDASGQLIHEVVYSRSWYGNTSKDDGGYTLELINPDDPCLAASNWIASSSASGGTPSAQNSNWARRPPSMGILAQRVVAISDSEIEVSFDRIPSTGLSEMDFSIAPSIGIVDIMEVADDLRSYRIVLRDNLMSGVTYTLTIDGSTEDCVGGSNNTDQNIDFVLPESYSAGDIIINELLFNPIGTESDYIEIYNRSGKFIDVEQLMIGNLDMDGSGSTRSIDPSYILAPEDYLVLTENRAALLLRYPAAIAAKVLEVDLPSFNNNDGNVTLFLDDNGMDVIINALDYTEDMHHAAIDDYEGVALERVDADVESNVVSNWQSGAASSGYGTPTRVNSQSIDGTPSTVDFVFLEQKTFYPSGTRAEVLDIVFQVDRPDYIGTLDIYDGSGRHIHRLASNQLIGRHDVYQWNGRNQQGHMMNAGVYIIVVQLVTLDGNLWTKKLPCVLSRGI